MAALPVVPYIKRQPVTDPESQQRYLDGELQKLQTAINAIVKAIQQLQVYTGVH